MKKFILFVLIIVSLIINGCFEDKVVKVDENTDKIKIDGKIFYIFSIPLYSKDANGNNMLLKYEDISVNFCGEDQNIIATFNKQTGKLEIKVEENYLAEILKENSSKEAYITCSSPNFFLNSFTLQMLLNNKYGIMTLKNQNSKYYFKAIISGLEKEGILILKRKVDNVTKENIFYVQNGEYYINDFVEDYTGEAYYSLINTPLEVYVLGKNGYACDVLNYYVSSNNVYISNKNITLAVTDYPKAGNIDYLAFLKQDNQAGFVIKTDFPQSSSMYSYSELEDGRIKEELYVKGTAGFQLSMPSGKYNIIQIGNEIRSNFYNSNKTIVNLIDLLKYEDTIIPVIFSKLPEPGKQNLYDYKASLENVSLDFSFKEKILCSNPNNVNCSFSFLKVDKNTKTSYFMCPFYKIEAEINKEATATNIVLSNDDEKTIKVLKIN